jgi:hypothetical protein
MPTLIATINRGSNANEKYSISADFAVKAAEVYDSLPSRDLLRVANATGLLLTKLEQINAKVDI